MQGGGTGIWGDWIGDGGVFGGSGGAIVIWKTSFIKHNMAGDDDAACVLSQSTNILCVPMDSLEEHIV
jgi:hypothetical protein